MTNDLFDSYLQFVEQRDQQPELLTQYENHTFGWDHAIAGACLARRWYLPDELVCCILMHHRGLQMLADPVLKRTSAAAVAIASLLPDQLRQNYSGLEQLLLLQEKWAAFDLELLINRVDELHGKAGKGVKNEFPLARRCKNAIDQYKEKQDQKLDSELVCT